MKVHVDKLKAMDADSFVIMTAQRDLDDHAKRIVDILEVPGRLGWHWKGGRDDLTAACRAAWTSWSAAKAGLP